MKKILGIILLLFIYTTNWVSAQCQWVSPDPICTEVDLITGEMRVFLDISTMAISGGPGVPTPADISQFELFYKTTVGGAWTLAATAPIAGMFPTSIVHPGVNQNNIADAFYMIRATCVGPPLTVLQDSKMIQAIKIKGSVSNDFEVNLNWNWDLLMTDTIGTLIQNDLQRSFPVPATYIYHASTPFSQSVGTYTDTVNTCDDSVGYYLVVGNSTHAPNVCQSVTNKVKFRIQDNTGPIITSIDSVSFDDLTNRPQIGWTASPSSDTKGYYIYEFYNNDCSGGFNTDSNPGVANTIYTDMTRWDAGRPAMYSIQAYDDCGQRSVVTDCNQSMFLIPTLDVCEKSVRLDWNHYEGFASGTDVLYKVMVRINGSAFVQAGSSTTDDFFIHTDPTENALLTYKVVAFENGGLGPFTASSNRVVVDAEFLKQPEFEYLRYATIAHNEDVRLELYTDVASDAASYYLKRSLDTSDVFSTVNVFYAPDLKIPADSIITMVDRSALVDKQNYFYVVDLYDSCGAFMSRSNVASTAMLKIDVDNVKRVNRLEWTNIIGWQGGTFSYKIYRFLDGKQLRDPITVFPDSAETTVHYDSLLLINDNVTAGRPSQGEYCYYVEAIENEPTFKGVLPAISKSNEVCVVQLPYVSVPNAFTPNGDGRNESFRPVVVYHDISNYEFYVMNRHGEIVYQTTNVSGSWDGTFVGRQAPQGVYVYSVKYSASTGQKFENNGTLTLVR